MLILVDERVVIEKFSLWVHCVVYAIHASG